MKVVLLLFAALFGVGVYGQITASMKDKILFAHNKARAEKGLDPLVWDDTVANVAQNYANRCVYQHSSGSGYGENIAAGWPPGSFTVNAANRGWIDDEYGDWKCGDAIVGGNTRPPANYDHYTQVMWASTKSIGCGWATDCPASARTGNSRFDFIVCNFNSGGNILGRVPFPASQCNNIVPCSPDNTCNEKGNVDFYDAYCKATISCPAVTTAAATTAATTAASTATTARPITTTATTATSVRPATTTTVRPISTTTATTASTAVSTATTARSTTSTTTATTRSSTATTTTTTTTQSATTGTSKSTTTTATTPTTTASTPSTPTTTAPSATSTPSNDSVGESSASVLLPSFLALLSVVALFVLSRL